MSPGVAVSAPFTFNSASACNKARASNYEKFKAYLGNEPRNTWWEAVLMQDFSAK